MYTAQSKEKRSAKNAVDADMSQKEKHVSSATWFLTSVDFGDNPPEIFLWKDGVRFAVKNASGNMEGCGPVQAVCCVEDSDEDVIKVSVSFLGIKECCTAGLQFGLNVAHCNSVGFHCTTLSKTHAKLHDYYYANMWKLNSLPCLTCIFPWIFFWKYTRRSNKTAIRRMLASYTDVSCNGKIHQRIFAPQWSLVRWSTAWKNAWNSWVM